MVRSKRMAQVGYGALAFAEAHGLETYDPSDIKGIKLILWTYTKGTAFARLVRLMMFGGIYLAPIGMRKIFGVKPSQHALGVATLASAYLETWRRTGEDSCLSRARPLLEWLEQNTADSSVGESWGTSFPWFTYAGVVPTGVGNAHGTVASANAFLSFYKATGDPWALEHSVRACEFLTRGLNYAERPSGSLAISYTPRDHSQCINVNAETASLLLRVGEIAGRPEYRDTARRFAQFVFETQQPDGSWYYDEPVPGVYRVEFIDGFHTAMVLSALSEMVTELNDFPDLQHSCKAAMNHGLAFYIQRLFAVDGTPMYALMRRYPIDPYSCGQAIKTLIDAIDCDAVSPQLRDEANVLLTRVADRTLALLLDSDGSFFTARYRFRVFRLKSLRWAQALMAFAFMRYSRFLLSHLRGGAGSFESIPRLR